MNKNGYYWTLQPTQHLNMSETAELPPEPNNAQLKLQPQMPDFSGTSAIYVVVPDNSNIIEGCVKDVNGIPMANCDVLKTWVKSNLDTISMPSSRIGIAIPVTGATPQPAVSVPLTSSQLPISRPSVSEPKTRLGKWFKQATRFGTQAVNAVSCVVGPPLFVVWTVSSLGVPFLATYYMMFLGSFRGIDWVDEGGGIGGREANTPFEKTMTMVGSLPLATMLGPISIPYSLFFVLKGTFEFFVTG